MASGTESSSGWSFGGGGSIWQGPTARASFDRDDPTWHGWHAVDFNHEKRQDQRPRSSSSFPPFSPPETDHSASSTLYMGDLEPWMDHEYASQVVHLMGWDRSSNSSTVQNNAVTIKIPPPPSDAVPQPNNPGYCLLTFPSPAHAANVLASLHSANSKNPGASPLLMPNSSRPFNLQWANPSQLSPANSTAAFVGQPQGGGVVNGILGATAAVAANQGPQREFSIFVGDLAPETSNSDLVAVFRNPVLGLRNDREPKFIRPFYSCKSAKIMLDPVTGVSRGYGFVRFTDEADQQRALIEMHGLYCLSRPMRVSPATAKFKPNPSVTPGGGFLPTAQPSPITLTFPAPTLGPQSQDHEDERSGSNGSGKANASVVRSVSSPVAAPSASSITTSGTTSSSPSNASSTPTSAPANGKHNGNAPSPPLNKSATPGADAPSQGQGDLQNMPHILAQIAQLASGKGSPGEWNSGQDSAGYTSSQQAGTTTGALGSYPSSSSITSQPPPYSGQSAMFNAGGLNGAANGASAGDAGGGMFDEAWTHQAQARAILGNLIGPNGEQLTSTDPYNTTVFVGGLSPLISEETLRTFFAPFGDIHYVKVPLGKHCGFVQFVRKADAERAIERMQGFPIGGSRIRLSWGRSQYKAAQAAAQAAQAAQAEQAARMSAAAAAASSTNAQNPSSLHITPEQALLLLQSLGYNPPTSSTTPSTAGNPTSYGGLGPPVSFANGNGPIGGQLKGAVNSESDACAFTSSEQQQRIGFSPFSSTFNGQEQHPLMTPSSFQPLPHPSRSYAAGFGPSPSSASGKYSDTNSPHSSSTDSSSGSSSVRFSGVGSGTFPSSAFLDNPNSSFQVSDILRHDSQTLLPRLSAPTSQQHFSSQSQSQESSARVTPPRHPHQSQGQGLRDDATGDLMQDVNGTLASLDLGETYSRGALGNMKDGYSNGDRRPLPTSISAPLRKFTSPSQKSGSSTEST